MRQLNKLPDQPAERTRPLDRVPRRGLILTETLISGIAIGSAAILTVTMLGAVNGNRQNAQRLLVATQELNNQLERLTARSWTELTPQLVEQVQLSPQAAASLPQAELRIRVQPLDKPLSGKRLEGELRWQHRNNAWRPPLRMTAWVFAPKEVP